ncbi:MAG TPA: cellulase family glycosylhydrolase [Dehalococcoidia bacterium]|nr:cellulase family glycosylhydrolase [Dehalococcoidia bacterium]
MPPPSPSPTDSRVKQLTASPDYSLQVFLWGNPGTTDRDLKLVRDAGFTWIKQMFQWNYIEGKAKGQYEWHEPDRIVEATKKYDLKILARVDVTPFWARPAGSDKTLHGPPENLADYGEFLRDLAARYKGQIKAYQIWNEPNLMREWGGEAPDPVKYTALLKIAYEAIKASDPDAIVISAGLSPTTASGAYAMPDVEFLQKMYDAGAGKYFDQLGVHGAGFRSEPEADPAQVALDPVASNGDQSPPELRRVYAFRHIEDLRQIMIRNGDERKQVAVLEFGWTSDKRSGSPYAWYAVSEAVKADYLVRSYTYARENWQPWIGIMSAIYIAAPHWTPNDEQYYWSVTDPSGATRPAYDALKAMRK